ncbi:hypothetical protein GCM10027271_40480 [Saccharopolyspora gloriosae]
MACTQQRHEQDTRRTDNGEALHWCHRAPRPTVAYDDGPGAPAYQVTGRAWRPKMAASFFSGISSRDDAGRRSGTLRNRVS